MGVHHSYIFVSLSARLKQLSRVFACAAGSTFVWRNCLVLKNKLTVHSFGYLFNIVPIDVWIAMLLRVKHHFFLGHSPLYANCLNIYIPLAMCKCIKHIPFMHDMITRHHCILSWSEDQRNIIVVRGYQLYSMLNFELHAIINTCSQALFWYFPSSLLFESCNL